MVGGSDLRARLRIAPPEGWTQTRLTAYDSPEGEYDMDSRTAAKRLDGSEYRQEGSPELFAEMAQHRLVAFFGCSDDLIEMRGAIHDEASEGAVMLTSSGLLVNDCRNRSCPYFAQLARYASTVEGKYGDDGWRFTTALPHERFDVLEDGDRYGEGLVICLDDVP
jgi:hypothetical protein